MFQFETHLSQRRNKALQRVYSQIDWMSCTTAWTYFNLSCHNTKFPHSLSTCTGRPDRPLQDIVNKLVPGLVYGKLYNKKKRNYNNWLRRQTSEKTRKTRNKFRGCTGTVCFVAIKNARCVLTQHWSTKQRHVTRIDSQWIVRHIINNTLRDRNFFWRRRVSITHHILTSFFFVQFQTNSVVERNSRKLQRKKTLQTKVMKMF